MYSKGFCNSHVSFYCSVQLKCVSNTQLFTIETPPAVSVLHTYFVDDDILFVDCFNAGRFPHGFYHRWTGQHPNMNPVGSGVKGRQNSGMLQPWKHWRQHKWKQTLKVLCCFAFCKLCHELHSLGFGRKQTENFFAEWQAKVKDMPVDQIRGKSALGTAYLSSTVSLVRVCLCRSDRWV